jgi:hypothetical protein
VREAGAYAVSDVPADHLGALVPEELAIAGKACQLELSKALLVNSEDVLHLGAVNDHAEKATLRA